MSILTISQAIANVQKAGFSGDSVIATMVSIQICESRLNTHPKDNINSNGSRDRGLNQINNIANPDVPDSVAYDGFRSTQAAYTIYQRWGNTFNAWSTYKDGCYKQYMSTVQDVLASSPAKAIQAVSGTDTTIPEWCKPLMNLSLADAESKLNHYPTSSEGWYEGGVDWTPPPGTPITALLGGIVIGAGYFCKDPANYFATDYRTCGGSTIGYGVVTIRSKNPYPNLVSGQYVDIYYQHIIIDSSIRLSNSGGSGQKVNVGQQIGVSNPSFNLEIGLNIGKEWGGIWGTSSSGPHVDPIPFLYTLISGGVPSSTSTNSAVVTVSGMLDNVHETLNNVPGFLGICEALDLAEQFKPMRAPTKQGDSNFAQNVFNQITGISDLKELAAMQQTITLPSDTLQALLIFIVENTRAALIRGLLILLGTIICIALIINLIKPEETAQKAVSLIGGLI